MPDQIFVTFAASPMKLSAAASHVKLLDSAFPVKLSTLCNDDTLESAMVELEEGHEGVFKVMIQARVSRPLHLRPSSPPLRLW
ncbi:hypothetical protein Bca52824_010222 [Brassica carinata]|uniref:Uncharacterized protein n=1 Tax=Brassica carinata TaxID=52824 RepID=A0A8X7WBC7_BRACI|nr:hypothetical protein Bca52824_010222 [Brassica carinata]